MKKYLFGIFALVLAIGMSSYTVRFADKFFPYDGSGSEALESNYGAATTESCPSPNNVLCGIVVNADADSDLEQTELDDFIDSSRDPDHDGNFTEEGETSFIKLKP
jgi:hypothetical protein